MVLNRCFMVISLALYLTGCSSWLKNPEQRSQQVIPAYTDPDEDQGDAQDDDQVEVIKAEAVQMNDRRATSSVPKIASPTAQVPQEQTEVKSPGNTAEIPYPLIIQSLIARAEKAIKMQQWLRAQLILEQALHIAPNNAKVFVIYGDVYLNLGILAQAEQMYRRSITLAGEQSPMGRLAKNKLEVLKTGN